MTTRAVPPGALAFAASHLATGIDFEILRLLVESDDRWWDADMLSREVRVPAALVREVLDRFAAANLLDIRAIEDVRYRFCPGTHELDDAARTLIRSYRRNPAAVRAALGTRRSMPAEGRQAPRF